MGQLVVIFTKVVEKVTTGTFLDNSKGLIVFRLWLKEKCDLSLHFLNTHLRFCPNKFN